MKNENMPIQKCLNGESVSNLSDIEIIAIILGTGSKGNSVIDCSFNLLKKFNGIRGLYDAGIKEIANFTGMGPVKAIRLKAAIEIGKRLLVPNNTNVNISGPEDVYKYILKDIAFKKQEEFWVLILNHKNKIIKKYNVSVGTISEALVHPREVFKEAVRESASSIIIIHNHPSGDLTPSENDIEVTKRISKAGKILGIELLDHIIVSDNDYVSLREIQNSIFIDE